VLEAGVRDEGVEAAVALERGVDGGAVALPGGEVGRDRVAAIARPIPLAAPVTRTTRSVTL
jgi:hypothetical protein